MHGTELFTICGILAAGFVCQWIAWRVKLPAIVFLLLAGIVAGPVTGALNPDELLGDLIVPFVSMGVAIILFEGALTLKFSDIRGHGSVVARLVTVGVLITWVGSTLSAYLLLDWNFFLALLFGAIVTVSGPTVVMPILRSIRPKKSVASVLRWEAILIDPVGAVLALLVLEFIIAAQVAEGLWQAAQSVVVIASAGTALGMAGGLLLGQAIRRRLIPDYLRDFAALAAVLIVFSLAEFIQGESGLLAVTVMGIWLANLRGVDLDDILDFKESLTLLLVASLFIVLAARIDLEQLYAIGPAALGLVLILQFLVGPLRAFVCSFGSSLSWQEKVFLGWVFPRGIVAAAISAIFALRLAESGQAGADSLVPVVFSIIIGTVLIQSLTARLLAGRLDVSEPDANGVLILGSNPIAIPMAVELREQGLPVLIADTHWASVQEARMQGLPTFFGSAVSRYADSNLDVAGLGVVLAMSRRPGINELACMRFSAEFGRDNVYTISNQPRDEHDKHKVTGERMGRMLFDGDVPLSMLNHKLAAGYELRTTKLTDEFDFAEYLRRNPEAQLLFAIDEEKRVRFPVADEELAPLPGWAVCSVVVPAQ